MGTGIDLDGRRDWAQPFEGGREKYGWGGWYENWLAVDWDHSGKREEYLQSS